MNHMLSFFHIHLEIHPFQSQHGRVWYFLNSIVTSGLFYSPS